MQAKIQHIGQHRAPVATVCDHHHREHVQTNASQSGWVMGMPTISALSIIAISTCDGTVLAGEHTLTTLPSWLSVLCKAEWQPAVVLLVYAPFKAIVAVFLSKRFSQCNMIIGWQAALCFGRGWLQALSKL